MEWPAETIQRLRDLWDEGLSTADIGRRLGLTKNAVVGKAHRLDLPARPSPIRRDGQPRPVYVRKPRILRETLPPLLSCLSSPTPPPEPRKAFIPRIKNPEAPMSRPTAAKSVLNGPVCECKWPLGDPKTKAFLPRIKNPESPMSRPTAAKSVFVGPPKPCCWPLGDPRDRENFRFCMDPSEPGKPYCPDHVKLAYMKVRDEAA
jgi:GcrA cell cycle regulator